KLREIGDLAGSGHEIGRGQDRVRNEGTEHHVSRQRFVARERRARSLEAELAPYGAPGRQRGGPALPSLAGPRDACPLQPRARPRPPARPARAPSRAARDSARREAAPPAGTTGAGDREPRLRALPARPARASPARLPDRAIVPAPGRASFRRHPPPAVLATPP